MQRASLLGPTLFSLWFACSAQSIQPLSLESHSPKSAREAQIHPEAIMLQGEEWVIPELIIGGEWTSSITLTNRGTQPIPPTGIAR